MGLWQCVVIGPSNTNILLQHNVIYHVFQYVLTHRMFRFIPRYRLNCVFHLKSQVITFLTPKNSMGLYLELELSKRLSSSNETLTVGFLFFLTCILSRFRNWDTQMITDV